MLKNSFPSYTHPPECQRRIHIIEGYKRVDLEELDEDVDLLITYDDLNFLDEIKDKNIGDSDLSERIRLIKILEIYKNLI